jgi:hypothetical protein
VEKWSEINCTTRHDVEECITYLDCKKMSDKPVVQELRQGDHRRANSDNDKQLGEINVIFKGSLSITSKTRENKLEWEINLAQQIEPRRRMKWYEVDISFGLDDHLEIELSNQYLPFIIKLLIIRHKVVETLIDNGASLNLIMRKTCIEMSLSMSDLTPIHNTFHGVIPGQSSTTIRRIDLEVSCESGDNKR